MRDRNRQVLLDVEEFDRLPRIAYVPTRSLRLGESALVFELRETHAGQTALMAYSSLPALVAGCGTGQSWSRLRADRLAALRRRLGFDVVVLDQALPPELRHPELDAVDFPDLAEVEVEHNSGDVVYVPSRPFRRGDQDVRLELQPGQDRRPAVLAYFSPEQLHAACGPHQAWVAVRADRIGAVAKAAGAATVLFNAALPEELRHRGPVQPLTRRSQEDSVYEW